MLQRRLPTPNTRAGRPLRRIGARSAFVASTLATAATLSVLPTAAAAAPIAAAPAPAAPSAQERAVAPVAHTAGTQAAGQAARGAARSSAVQNALGKIGAPYRWGATGPSSFDCSGLVNWAYKQEGVSLPRSSKALASAGSKISRSELRPGDLVLFYKPVSHVGIYVGNGKVVHASTSGSPVKVSGMDQMPFNSARRI